MKASYNRRRDDDPDFYDNNFELREETIVSKVLGGFDNPPRKDSFAARVARAKNASDTTVDQTDLTPEERVSLAKASALENAANNFTFVKPESAIERVEIIFDDSGSMGGGKISDAIAGVTEFMKACIPNETAVRVTPLNARGWEDSSGYGGSQVIKFTTNLPSIAGEVASFRATGGTPLYAKIKQALENDGRRHDLKPSRIIAFSDGQADEGSARKTRPTYWQDGQEMEPAIHREVIALAKQFGIAIDTCYIASERSRNLYSDSSDPAEETMQRIAEETGGIYIRFEQGKCDFSRGFKYLTKGNRLLLTDQAFKSKLEAGQI